MWGALANGGRLVIYPPGVPDPDSITDMIRRHGITQLWLTAGLFHSLMDIEPDCLSGLRRLLVGGDVVSPGHVRRLLERQRIEVRNGYGPTETTTFACVSPPIRSEDTGADLHIGGPIGNTRVYVVDGALQPVPVGVPGELVIGGAGLARGYARRPAPTAEKFVPDPFGPVGGRLYRTGDIVRWRPDGTLQYQGRADDQVKVRGFRIELGEIESCVHDVTGLHQVLLVVHEPAPGDKRLVAYLVGADAERAAVELPGLLRDRLPDYMVPSAFVPVARIPLTSNGKPDRAALPAPQVWGGGTGADFTAARTPLEEGLAGIWARHLGHDRIGVHDEFFALGGTSLLALRLVADIRRELGAVVSIADLFQGPTIAELARLITAAPAHRPDE
jgi:acyl-coenzyme A synthetase/AMP-(fatty) acid ligase/acyl carrier protein